MTREDAKREMLFAKRNVVADSWIDKAYDVAIQALSQPERKKGKWLLSDKQHREDTDNGNYRYVCSNCRHSDIHAKTQKVPYCWWCGAYMGGEQDG